MKNARVWRFFVFTIVVSTILFGNDCTQSSFARPLFETGITVSKEASPSTFNNVGEEITYIITVRRTDNNDFRMDSIKVTDDLIEITCDDATVLNEETPPARCAEPRYSGEMTCTGTYIITEEDIAAGEVTNTVTTSAGYYGRIVCGGCSESEAATPEEISAQTSNTITYEGPELTLEKQGSPEYFTQAGEEIKYTYVVKNTSVAHASEQITISDDMVGVECPSGGLQAGESMTCTASYTTTADDVATGVVRNTATAFSGSAESNADSFEVLLEASPEISLSKAGTPTNFTNPNEIIVFSFNATNTGNVSLSAPFTLSDPMLDELECKYPTMLMPSASFTCVGYHRIQGSDIGNTMQNCATVSGLYNDNTVTSAEACTDIYFEPPREPEPDLPPPPDDPPTDV